MRMQKTFRDIVKKMELLLHQTILVKSLIMEKHLLIQV